MFDRFLACAALALGCSAAAHAQSTPTVSAPDAVPGLSREQVLADLQQWHAAGMTFVANPAGYSDSAQSPEYQRYLQQNRASTATQSSASSVPVASPAVAPQGTVSRP